MKKTSTQRAKLLAEDLLPSHSNLSSPLPLHSPSKDLAYMKKSDHRPAPTEDEQKKLAMIDAIKAQIDAKHTKKKTPRQK